MKLEHHLDCDSLHGYSFCNCIVKDFIAREKLEALKQTKSDFEIKQEAFDNKESK
jgi:hypothetical protein